jgi:hypothetical protein
MTDRSGFHAGCEPCGHEGYFRDRAVAESVAQLHADQEHDADREYTFIEPVEHVPPGAFPEEPEHEHARVVADA